MCTKEGWHVSYFKNKVSNILNLIRFGNCFVMVGYYYHNRFRHIVQEPTKDGLPCPDNLMEVGNCIYCSDNSTIIKEPSMNSDCIKPCASKTTILNLSIAFLNGQFFDEIQLIALWGLGLHGQVWAHVIVEIVETGAKSIGTGSLFSTLNLVANHVWMKMEKKFLKSLSQKLKIVIQMISNLFVKVDLS